MDETRQLLTMMFTDIVGYTQMAQRDERRALEVLADHHQVVRSTFPGFRAEEVKTIGDAFLVAFPSALEALRCALAIQRAVASAHLAGPDGRPLQLRIGIHLGDVVRSGKDVLGDAVNIAARVERLAEPGGICISSAVYDQVRNKLDATFVKMERPELKNVETPLDVYRIEREGTAPTEPAPSRSGKSTRLAVLPFANMSPDPQDEFFADGLTEEMITELSQVPGLEVIARTSVVRYKGTTKAIREIGRELGVSMLLEGSVRKALNRIRITAQMIDATTEAHVWAERFDRELTDIFSVQTEIAQQVGSHLGTALKRDRTPSRPPSGDLEVYLLYLKGRFLWARRTLPSVQQALRAFEETVRLDPDFAQAHSGIADCYMILSNNFEELSWKEAGPKAKAAASRAVELDDGAAEAHASLGLALHRDYDWKPAERHLLRALELNPAYAPAHLWYHLLLMDEGRVDEGAREIARARELDPLSPVVLFSCGTLALYRGATEETLRHWTAALEIEPRFADSLPVLRALVELDLGRAGEAQANLARAEATWSAAGPMPEEAFTWIPAFTLAVAGRKAEARRSLERLSEIAARTYVPAAGFARIYAALGDSDQSFAWLLQGVADHSTRASELRTALFYQRFREDPRFSEVLRRCGLTL